MSGTSSRFPNPGSKCNFRKCLAQFLVPLFLAAPDDGNTIDNKEITMHRHFRLPALAALFLTGAFSSLGRRHAG